MPPARWALGIDMGGTFIDAVACSDDGRLHALKHPREAGAPAASVLAALEQLLATHGIAAADVARVVHGTTVVTNLLLERNHAPVAVCTSTGMRDVLVLARQDRRALYDAIVQPQVPEAALFPDHLRFELPGRIGADGREAQPLDEACLADVAERIAHSGVQAVAVCLLFSHLERHHEERVREVLRARCPGLHIALSCEVDPRPREFERFLTTALDAYVRPLVAEYLAELAQALAARGLPAPELMRSEGGIAGWRDVAQRPIGLAMSGPCAALQGVAACLPPSERARPVIAMDVGGTTTDIGLVEDGRPVFADGLEIGGLPLRIRCADVDSLAVGGGSRATALAGGALRIGPRSQGAVPGPAAYGRGGDQATLTDALCVLGRLPAHLAGGLALDRSAAEAALRREVAEPLGLPVAQAAQAVVDAASAAMAEALRMRSFQRGVDPADCLLIAAGGGGGQHAAEVAAWAGMPEVRVLPHASVIAAVGLLGAHPTQTQETACRLPLDAAGLVGLQALAGDSPASGGLLRWSLDVCYTGQAFTIEVPWYPAEDDAAALRQRFDARQAALRGMAMPAQAAEVQLLRCICEQPVPPPALAPAHLARAADVWGGIPAEGQGPQALFAPMSTVWVPRGWRWRLLPGGVLQLLAEDCHG